jgi:hypothetical protein
MSGLVDPGVDRGPSLVRAHDALRRLIAAPDALDEP